MAPPVTTNFEAWYDPRQITGQSDGSQPSTIADESGNGWTVINGPNVTGWMATGGSAGKAFYYSTTSAKLINGLPTIYFSSAVESLLTSKAMNLTSPFTLYYVLKNLGVSSNPAASFLDTYQANGASNTGRTISVPVNAASTGLPGIWDGNAWATATGAAGTSATTIYTIVYNGSSSVYRQNGVTYTLGANPGTNSLIGVQIGGSANGTNSIQYEGLMGEFLLYTVAHTSTQWLPTESYLTAWTTSAAFAPLPRQSGFAAVTRAANWRKRVSGLIAPDEKLIVPRLV